MKKIVLFTIMLFMLSLIVTSAMATVICLENGQGKTIGDTTALNLMMDSAPTGLSGYAITITISDPSVATITSVSFPSWATMKSNTILPSSSSRIKAVDMGNLVTPGAASIPFGTVYVTGLKSGTTQILVNATILNDDTGFTIDSAVRNGVFTAGATTPPSAAFESDCLSGSKFLSISYKDLSTGNPLAWNFGFSNGIFSAFKNPILT